MGDRGSVGPPIMRRGIHWIIWRRGQNRVGYWHRRVGDLMVTVCGKDVNEPGNRIVQNYVWKARMDGVFYTEDSLPYDPHMKRICTKCSLTYSGGRDWMPKNFAGTVRKWYGNSVDLTMVVQ